MATSLPKQKQQMVAYLDWEQNARRIAEMAPLLVPGILQTSDYIRGDHDRSRFPVCRPAR